MTVDGTRHTRTDVTIRPEKPPFKRQRLTYFAFLFGVLSAFGITACQPGPQFNIQNSTSEPINFKVTKLPSQYDPVTRTLDVASTQPGEDTGSRINWIGGTEGECHKQYQIIGTTASGKKYTYGPPVCNGGAWTIDKDTPYSQPVNK
ncbi:hypothetical protein ACFRR7_34305 [Streptomyces sp. NPDC056909]|uniref:hypothetical protein n=1 Tax=Streptomyces sp. NPDC056909 TaxID=3345963 RepID=UPI0036A7BFF3